MGAGGRCHPWGRRRHSTASGRVSSSAQPRLCRRQRGGVSGRCGPMLLRLLPLLLLLLHQALQRGHGLGPTVATVVGAVQVQLGTGQLSASMTDTTLAKTH